MTCFLPSAVQRVQKPIPGIVSAMPTSIPTPDSVKLTQYASGLGCACKIREQLLESILEHLPAQPKNSNLLVGTETGDDASVYKLSSDIAIINTTDFFPPIVDDALSFGKIAAANAISDVYAMGGRPITALSLVGFPTSTLPLETLERMMKGATEKATEAGVVISGGHTINLQEPILGLAVTGIVHPSKIIRNVGCKDGDVLILTKPLGTGVATAAMKRGEGVCPTECSSSAVQWMETLNKAGCEAVVLDEKVLGAVHAMTDITGFGLSGHLLKMLRGSSTDENQLVATIYADQLPLLPGVRHLLDQRSLTVYSSSSLTNLSAASSSLLFTSSVPYPHRLIVCDAQTSGGLLISASAPTAADAQALLERIRGAMPTERERQAVAIIGRVSTRSSHPFNKFFTPEKEKREMMVVVNSASELSGTNLPVLQKICLVDRDALPPTVVTSPHMSLPTPTSTSSPTPTPSHNTPIPPGVPSPSLVWFFKNSVITHADDVLGKLLVRGMLGKAERGETLPGMIVLMGDGVELSTLTADTVETLQNLERMGVTVLSCTTCLVHLKLTEKLRVGRAATAVEIAAILTDTSKQIVTIS